MTIPLSIPTARGDVAALLERPEGAEWLLVLAHGAGAGMRHRFMNDVAARFSTRGLATLRYEYPYVTAGRRRPDPAPVLESVTRQVVQHAADRHPDLRVAAGGKSMGGRMTSRAQAAESLSRVEALVFLGFPLHAAGRASTERADHLAAIRVPMLFLQGTRDALADLELMRGVTDHLGQLATLHIAEGADHGFTVLKRSGRTNDEVLDELADALVLWLRKFG